MVWLSVLNFDVDPRSTNRGRTCSSPCAPAHGQAHPAEPAWSPTTSSTPRLVGSSPPSATDPISRGDMARHSTSGPLGIPTSLLKPSSNFGAPQVSPVSSSPLRRSSGQGCSRALCLFGHRTSSQAFPQQPPKTVRRGHPPHPRPLGSPSEKESCCLTSSFSAELVRQHRTEQEEQQAAGHGGGGLPAAASGAGRGQGRGQGWRQGTELKPSPPRAGRDCGGVASPCPEIAEAPGRGKAAAGFLSRGREGGVDR